MNPLTLCFLNMLILAATAPVVTWLTPTEHDFGDIPQYEPVEIKFQYRNDGAEALVIDNVRPSCGCTSPDWSAAPLPPDSSATILIRFNARNAGYFRKLTKVYFRGQRRAERLYVEGFVLNE